MLPIFRKQIGTASIEKVARHQQVFVQLATWLTETRRLQQSEFARPIVIMVDWYNTQQDSYAGKPFVSFLFCMYF